ncbi:1993_t:CDS:2 [Acaulospora morrowiae]|uniref:1993_t:CDS:1 n=1 Tax=Acaulospora morrowiae TaxID=94023 RepID=A0A9N8ZPZ9_9GLOM|nr:1993_t:CDS:2 [Acaulospora morrowiae]
MSSEDLIRLEDWEVTGVCAQMQSRANSITSTNYSQDCLEIPRELKMEDGMVTPRNHFVTLIGVSILFSEREASSNIVIFGTRQSSSYRVSAVWVGFLTGNVMGITDMMVFDTRGFSFLPGRSLSSKHVQHRSSRSVMSLFILDDMIVDESGDSHENKRVKITTACDTCRRRKVKCDVPEAHSKNRSQLILGYQCTFSDASTKRPRGPPKGFVALIEDRLHTIESLLVNLVNKDNINENIKEVKREREQTIEETTTSTQQRFSTFKIRHYSPSTNNSQHHLFIPSTPPTDSAGLLDHSQSLMPSFGDELASDDEDCLQQNLISPFAENSLQSRSLSFLINQDQSDVGSYVEPPLPTSTPSLESLQPDVERQLLEKYFNHFHPYFPIVNRSQFIRRLNVEDQPSPLLLNAIYAVGALFPPVLSDSSNPSVYYERARSLLDHFIDVPRLSTVQALILLCMVDQGKPSSYRSQTYSSMAIRMAQSMGLNRRNGEVYQGKGRQTKKLVWWGCFIIDRLNSLSTGDPLAINDKLCDIEFPSPDEVDDQDENQQPSSSQQTNTQSSTYTQQINIFVNFARLARLTGQIIEHLQSVSCTGISSSWNHHVMVSGFENLLLSWLRELPPYLHYTPSPQHMKLPGHIASIHMHHQALFLMLHYPYIAGGHNSRSRNSRAYAKSLSVCTSAANRITHIGVEALNNINVCITFPTMFYCLGKAAKVHMINIASNQRGLAIPAYENIVKIIKICRFYEENNIIAELASQTVKALGKVLIDNQDKFSQEDNFISTSLPSQPSSTHNIKISPTMANQTYGGEPSTAAIDNRTSQAQLMVTVPPAYVPYSSHSGNSKRESPPPPSSASTNIQQQRSQNFSYTQAQENTTQQQFLPVNHGHIFDQFTTMQMQSPAMISTTVATEISGEPQFWELGMNFSSAHTGMVEGFNNNNPYNNQMTVTSPVSATSTTTTPSIPPSTVSSSPSDYFASQQLPQQQRQKTPSTSSASTFSQGALKPPARSSQMSLDSIERDSDPGSNMMTEALRNAGLQNVHNTQRYVFMDTNDNNDNGVYGRMSATNETHPRIFHKIHPRRMTKKEVSTLQDSRLSHTSNNGGQQSTNHAEAIYVLSRRPSSCGLTSAVGGLKFGASVGHEITSVGIGCDDSYEQQHNGPFSATTLEMKEINVGYSERPLNDSVEPENSRSTTIVNCGIKGKDMVVYLCYLNSAKTLKKLKR